MRRCLCILVLLLAAHGASAESWVFRPSTYSHDAKGQRVVQYAAPPPAYRPDESQYHQWGYRHQDTHIHIGNNCEHWHTFEVWRKP